MITFLPAWSSFCTMQNSCVKFLSIAIDSYAFLGSTYNIPICIWLQKRHPYIPPIVFVVPTPEMEIKVGRHVDTKGRVYLPFLSEWRHVSLVVYRIMSIVLWWKFLIYNNFI